MPDAKNADPIAEFGILHGRAANIAGQGVAYPRAVLNGGLLLIEYVGEQAIADRIERAVFDVLEEGKHTTRDLGGDADTARFTDAIIDKL